MANKAILEFDTDSTRGNWKLRRAMAGESLALAIWEYDQNLRAKIKYAPDNMSDEKLECLEEIRQLLWDTLEEYGVKFVLTAADE